MKYDRNSNFSKCQDYLSLIENELCIIYVYVYNYIIMLKTRSVVPNKNKLVQN